MYYQIKEINSPEQNGIVVMVKEGKLECLTGNQEHLKEFGCEIKDNKFVVGNDYYDTPISQRIANKLKVDYDTAQAKTLEETINILAYITGGGYPD